MLLTHRTFKTYLEDGEGESYQAITRAIGGEMSEASLQIRECEQKLIELNRTDIAEHIRTLQGLEKDKLTMVSHHIACERSYD